MLSSIDEVVGGLKEESVCDVINGENRIQTGRVETIVVDEVRETHGEAGEVRFRVVARRDIHGSEDSGCHLCVAGIVLDGRYYPF